MSTVDIQLHAALARAVAGVPHHELRGRVAALSHRYRTEQIADAAPGIRDSLDALAYAVVRMPATFRALHAALSMAGRHVDSPFTTHLDFGGGTGAAAWAAASLWPAIRTEIVERQSAAIRLGKQLAAGNLPSSWRWTSADLREWSRSRHVESGPVDLVTIGYVLNELSADDCQDLIHTAARSATTIVVVEPGTPSGHRRTLAARDLLIKQGFTIAAPCPHQGPCPVDWCHFAARLPRTELHRTMKAGALNYEDEKFSYLVATRATARPAVGRVIGRPVRRKGQILLDLCMSPGTAEQVVVPKSSDAYRAARRANWGDPWPQTS